MNFVEGLYLATTAGLAFAGLTMVWMAIRAYLDTEKHAMVHLSIGFALIVAAAVATTISAFVTDFENVRSLLVVNSTLTTTGFMFVVYSLVSYN